MQEMAHQNIFTLLFHWTCHSTLIQNFSHKNRQRNSRMGEAIYLLGSILPCGKLTSKTMQKANTKVESNSIRRHSHSIAARLQKNGRAKLSRRKRFLFMNLFSCPKPLIVAAPAIDSPKRLIIGDFWMLTMRTNSLDEAM